MVSNPRLALFTLCVAVLIAQVDTSVINLALRPIGEHFDATVTTLQWVADSYNLVYAVLLLTGGLIADLYGRRRTLMIGAAIFTGASLLCALAPTISVLIAGRAIAGIGAALLLPSSLAMIRVVWPNAAARAHALGIWAACSGVAFVIGPSIGGALIRVLGWQSVFFIVVPLGIATLALARPALPESADPQDRHFDAGAQILGALSLGGFALAAIQSHSTLAVAFCTLFAAIAALGLFIVVERRRGANALVPLEMFSTAEFSGAIASTGGMTFGLYGVLFLLPLTWQTTGRLDPLGAGLALMPMALFFTVLSPMSGRLTLRFGSRFMTTTGGVLIAAGVLLIGIGAPFVSLLVTEIGLGLAGLGMAISGGPLMNAGLSAVAAARAGTAAALFNVARMTGATLGVALLGSVYELAGGGITGLRTTMIAGSAVQCLSAFLAAMTIGRDHQLLRRESVGPSVPADPHID